VKIKHRAELKYPFVCIVCGKFGHRLVIEADYKNNIYVTTNFCSEECFEKMFSSVGISFKKKSVLRGKHWGDFWAKREGYYKYTIIEKTGEKVPIIEYKIDDDAVFDVKIFSTV
jgi:predicted nucleic acid-binding Zn ribbon protein